jgi:hypothetical protein
MNKKNRNFGTNPKTIQECELRRKELVELLLGVQCKISQDAPDGMDADDYQLWLKKSKKLVLRAQFEIARINKIKTELLQIAGSKPAVPKQTESTNQTAADKPLISKAFALICDDVIADNVPALNSAKAIASYYLAISGLPDGNRVAALADVSDDEEDE